jgi:hypothetical protein
LGEEFENWKRQNATVATVAVALVGDHLLRGYLRKVGYTPAQVLIPVIIARLGAEASGLYLANLIDGDKGVQNWIVASNKMFSWGGLEQTSYGSLLSLIPNPVGVAEVLFESGVKIGQNYEFIGRDNPYTSVEQQLALIEMYTS